MTDAFLQSDFCQVTRGRVPGVKDGGNSSPDGVEISHPAKWGWYALIWEFGKCLDPERKPRQHVGS